MKVLSILLGLVNSLVAGVVLLSCVPLSGLSWDGFGWLATRVATGVTVVVIGALTFRDGAHPVAPGLMLIAGLALILLGTGSAMWGLHLSLISGDVKNVMILFGGSLVLQGIASVTGLRETGNLAV